MRFQAVFFPFKEQSCYTALLKIDFLKAFCFCKNTQMALELPKVDIFQKWSKDITGDSQAVLSPNLTKKLQWEVSQTANKKFPLVML